jgi:hypothetical protein
MHSFEKNMTDSRQEISMRIGCSVYFTRSAVTNISIVLSTRARKQEGEFHRPAIPIAVLEFARVGAATSRF